MAVICAVQRSRSSSGGRVFRLSAERVAVGRTAPAAPATARERAAALLVAGLLEPARERLGPVEREDLAAARLRVRAGW